MRTLDTLTEVESAQWERFVEGLNTLMDESFPDGATVLVGAQFGSLGRAGHPPCVVTANIPVCSVAGCLEDMAAEVDAQHRLAHGDAVPGDEDEMTEVVPDESLPDEVREFIKRLGLDDSVEVTVHRVVDTSDLDALDETDEPG